MCCGKVHSTASAMRAKETTTNEPDFLRKFITVDESWVYGYDPETKAQSSQWKSPGAPHPKKVQQSNTKIKRMLTMFFDWESDVHHEYTPPGQTINKEYYLNIFHWFSDAIR